VVVPVEGAEAGTGVGVGELLSVVAGLASLADVAGGMTASLDLALPLAA